MYIICLKHTKKHCLNIAESVLTIFPTPDWDAESHLEAMDYLGISTSMLSLSSPHINFGDKELTKALARELNEDGAVLGKKYPGRFGLFASLPIA